MEDFTVRRRNRLRHHYTITSNVLLFGYRRLSGGAKLTYQVIDSFDWGDSAGLRKGFAYPSVARLAAIRAVNERTVRRHLAELEQVGLVTRQARPGRPNLLVIEDPSAAETQQYLAAFGRVGEDKIVRPTPDKNVRPYKKEEREERQTSLTREKTLDGIGKSSSNEHVSHAIRERLSSMRVTRGVDPPDKARREHLAQEMVDALGDAHSLGYYRRVAERYPPQVIYEALGRVKVMRRDGVIRKSPGAAFANLLTGDGTKMHANL